MKEHSHVIDLQQTRQSAGRPYGLYKKFAHRPRLLLRSIEIEETRSAQNQRRCMGADGSTGKQRVLSAGSAMRFHFGNAAIASTPLRRSSLSYSSNGHGGLHRHIAHHALALPRPRPVRILRTRSDAEARRNGPKRSALIIFETLPLGGTISRLCLPVAAPARATSRPRLERGLFRCFRLFPDVSRRRRPTHSFSLQPCPSVR